ncbi:MAG TPA: hypothetical protein VGL47_25985 [Amycolatopsis sp.]|uniref:Uncharacterized protein n=1 Tax=Amycolatopsis nalaikhensis TaxID=715472 RepID=A0ABY8XIF8_9PSEU|nr:hypothetical protein [Amycolatopsis sp. 2-2]WIV55415.1 hypothetical protein QP939_42455 [Amycolatopsis sp. 2-2]
MTEHAEDEPDTGPEAPDDEHRLCLERARGALVLAGWQVDAGG